MAVAVVYRWHLANLLTLRIDVMNVVKEVIAVNLETAREVDHVLLEKGRTGVVQRVEAGIAMNAMVEIIPILDLQFQEQDQLQEVVLLATEEVQFSLINKQMQTIENFSSLVMSD